MSASPYFIVSLLLPFPVYCIIENCNSVLIEHAVGVISPPVNPAAAADPTSTPSTLNVPLLPPAFHAHAVY